MMIMNENDIVYVEGYSEDKFRFIVICEIDRSKISSNALYSRYEKFYTLKIEEDGNIIGSDTFKLSQISTQPW